MSALHDAMFLTKQVYKRTTSPDFDDDFIFDVVSSDLYDRTLEILIYDATPAVGEFSGTNVSRDECLGQVLIPFDEINLVSTKDTVWLWKGVTPYTKKHEVSSINSRLQIRHSHKVPHYRL